MVTTFHDIEEIEESMRVDIPLEVIVEAPESVHSLPADMSKPTAPESSYFGLSLFSRMRTKLGKLILKGKRKAQKK